MSEGQHNQRLRSMSDNQKYSAIYLKFMSLLQAVRGMSNFSSIDPVEDHLLNMLASSWHQGKQITVLEAMHLSEIISPTTLHRRLMSLRSKGLLSLQTSETDNRVKYVIPTNLTDKYFSALGSALVCAQQEGEA